MTRGQLRRAMRTRRRALSPAAAKHNADAAARNATLWRAPFARAKTVSAYLADDGELDPAPLVARLRRCGKRIYVPVFLGRRMWFAPLAANARLARGRFGLLEPAGVRQRLRPLRGIDLALVPLVAIDQRGNRLGRGGGFYDRAFGRRRAAAAWKRPAACGFAHAFQQVEALPNQPWDAPIECLLSDARFARLT